MLYAVHPLYEDNAVKLRQWADGQVEHCINNRFVFADELQGDGTLPPAFLENMRRAVAQFNPETDYLVVSGDTMQVIAFTSMLAVTYPSYTILKYDRREDAYIPVVICSGLVPGVPLVLGSGTKSGDVEDAKDCEESDIRRADFGKDHPGKIGRYDFG